MHFFNLIWAFLGGFFLYPFIFFLPIKATYEYYLPFRLTALHSSPTLTSNHPYTRHAQSLLSIPLISRTQDIYTHIYTLSAFCISNHLPLALFNVARRICMIPLLIHFPSLHSYSSSIWIFVKGFTLAINEC